MKTKQEILDCPSDFILDAELYCVDGDEKPIDYYEVLKILHKKTPEPSNLRYVILDCLSMGGNCLLDMPFPTRLKTMETLPCLPIRSEENEDATAFYNQSISDGFDGILIKDMDAKYQPNEKSDSLIDEQKVYE